MSEAAPTIKEEKDSFVIREGKLGSYGPCLSLIRMYDSEIMEYVMADDVIEQGKQKKEAVFIEKVGEANKERLLPLDLDEDKAALYIPSLLLKVVRGVESVCNYLRIFTTNNNNSAK